MKKLDISDIAIIVAIGDYHKKVGEWPTFEIVFKKVRSYGIAIWESMFRKKCKKLSDMRLVEFLYDDMSKPPKWLTIPQTVEENFDLYKEELKKLIDRR
jgi:hypothetical protein